MKRIIAGIILLSILILSACSTTVQPFNPRQTRGMYATLLPDDQHAGQWIVTVYTYKTNATKADVQTYALSTKQLADLKIIIKSK